MLSKDECFNNCVICNKRCPNIGLDGPCEVMGNGMTNIVITRPTEGWIWILHDGSEYPLVYCPDCATDDIKKLWTDLNRRRSNTQFQNKFQTTMGGTVKTHIGRNDRCPCRSGKKFKNCCMKTLQEDK